MSCKHNATPKTPVTSMGLPSLVAHRRRTNRTAGRSMLSGLFLCMLVASGCGLSRDQAGELIQAHSFSETAALNLYLAVAPSTFVETAAIPPMTVPVVDAEQRRIGWRESVPDRLCLAALQDLGALSCGMAEYNNWQVGSFVARPCPEVWTPSEPHPPTVVPMVEFAAGWITTAEVAEYSTRSEQAFIEHEQNRGSGPAKTWILLTPPGTVRFGAVTGITEGPDGSKVVEFTWEALADRLAPLWEVCPVREGVTRPTSGVRQGSATLKEYDDGWRVESVTLR